MNELRFYGPPGCGKTTVLTRQIEREAQAYGPENVVCLSHTRAAAAELAGRDTCLPDHNIGTLHSIAWRALGQPGDVAEEPKHLRAFAERHDEWEFGGSRLADDPFGEVEGSGAQALQEYSRLRNVQLPRALWPYDILRFAETWEAWKESHDLVDFTDMIERALTECRTAPGYPTTIIADEEQDLSRLQFALLAKWGEEADRVITAGDQDQTIFRFSGADPRVFSDNTPADAKVLSQSYRLPRAVHEVAVRWIEQVSERVPVSFKPRDAEGSVETSQATWQYPEPLLDDVQAWLAAGESVMVEAACGFMLRPFCRLCREHAIPYANPWKRDRGDWNPLGGSEKPHAAVQALLDFLVEPTADGVWEREQMLRWSDVVKGCFRRGARMRLAAVPVEATRIDVYEALSAEMREQDLQCIAFGTQAERLGWFRDHLDAEHRTLGEFACELVSARGLGVLREPPKLYVGTVHSFKGGEADHVVLCPDLSAAGHREWVSDGFDDVIRTFYVGLTRARESLTLCAPGSFRSVDWSAVL